jgi:uncharacterized membrane protein
MWDVGTVLGRAWEIYRENVGILLLGFGLVWGANFVVQMPASMMDQVMPIVLRQADSTSAPLLLLMGSGLQFVFSVLSVLVQVFFGLGLVQLLLHVARGEEASLEDFVVPIPRFLNAMGAFIVLGLLTLAGLIACVVPGVIIWLGLFMWNYTLVDQDTGPIESLKESWRLTDGEKVPLFVFVIVAIMLNFTGFVACCVGLLVTIPMTALATTLIYDDMFSRKGPYAEGM